MESNLPHLQNNWKDASVLKVPLHLKGKDEHQMAFLNMSCAQAVNFKPIVSTALLGYRQHAEEGSNYVLYNIS